MVIFPKVKWKRNRTLGLRWLDMLITSAGRSVVLGLPSAPLSGGWWSLFPAYFKTEGVQAAERRGVRAWEVYMLPKQV